MTVLLNHIRKKAEADHNKKSVSAVLNRKTVDFEAEFGVPNLPPEFSAEAQAIFDRMPNPLTQTEKEVINEWVIASKSSGNFSKYDYFYGFFLSDRDNALTDWITGKTATAVNGPGHTANQGFLFNGSSQYINTNINTATDSNNFSLSSATLAFFCYENFELEDSFKIPYGAYDGAQGLSFFQSNDVLPARLISSTVSEYNQRGKILNSSSYVHVRDSISNTELFENGNSLGTFASNATNLVNEQIFVGGRNLGGLDFPMNYSSSYFFIGGLFNQSALNTELSILENDLII